MKIIELKKIVGISFSLARANIKLRHEGSYLGIFWYLLDPLVMFLIILFIRETAFSQKPILYYPIYLILGLTLYNFFTQIMNSSINAIQENADIIKSMVISLESLVIAKIIQAVFSHFFEFALVVIIAIFFRVPAWSFLFYIFPFIFFLMFVLGLAFLFATIGAYVSDFKNVWAVISRLLFFLTPIFYVVTPGHRLYFVNYFNPLFYYLTICRDIALYGKIPPWPMLIFTALMSMFFLFVGHYIFKRCSRKFAELI